ncbi:MAG: ATP-grasp domain-containing protein [Prosthecobacter sp.]|uniref:ATP-grasp domain-containing protein n=1 Tax=Prosthecobacter sp. TaxID=1965333 RepID=UPI0038FDAD38
MTAYIQKHQGEFANINTFTAYLGFREKGYELRCFEWEELDHLEISTDTPVSGGIPVVVAALAKLGVPAPELPSIPPVLQPFAGRKTWLSTMQAARAAVQDGSMIFVKPVPKDRKLFVGTVFRSFRDTISTAHVPSDYPVICSDVVDFVSEFRAFVLDGEILDLRHYKGDFRRYPDMTVVDSAVAAYSTAPKAFGIDFGVTSEGRTLLVETNEAYSLGCYGLAALLYSTLLERRWSELTATPSL